LAKTARETTDDLEHFAFAEAARRLRDFTWNDFCDWYVEFQKGRLRAAETRPAAQRVLATVLDGLCRLLHPIVPFLTEQVWQSLAQVAPTRGLPSPSPALESVCIASWPVYPESWADSEAESIVGLWQEVTKSIRNLLAERNVPRDAKVSAILVASGTTAERLRQGEPFIRAQAPAASLTITSAAERPVESAVAVLPDVEVIVPLANLIDREAEAARHRKTLADLDRQIASLQAKIGNAEFVNHAPAVVVDRTRAKLQELTAQRLSVASLLGVQ
jgi:valyl-tRNA synthetase